MTARTAATAPHTRRLAFVLASVLTASAVAQDRQPPPAPFRTEAELVIIDAVVVDRDGRPVTDLKAGDFEVQDEGEPREIRLFQTIAAPPSAAPGATPPALPEGRAAYSTNAGAAARPGRAFVVFYDDIHLTREDGERAKGAIVQFLERETRPGDLVSLVAPGRSLRWHARMPEGREELAKTVGTLKGLYLPDLSTERMSDYEAYRIHNFQDEAVADRVDRRWQNFRVLGREPTDLSSDKGFQPQNRGNNVGLIKPDIAIRAAALYAQVAARNRATQIALARTVDTLASVRGRKSLVLVSPGFIEDQERREGRLVLDVARLANVAVYFVDTRGLITGSPYGQAQFGAALDARDVTATSADSTLEAEGAENLSRDSGGFSIRNANDLAAALGRIGRESASYYLIGFEPPQATATGVFRRLEVKVRRPGVVVRARRGYSIGGRTTAATTADARNEEALDRAAESPYDLGAIPLRCAAFVFGESSPGHALTMLAIEADLRSFAFKRDAGGVMRGALHLRVLVTEQSTGTTERYDRDVAMSFPGGTTFDADSWHGEAAEFRLAPGRYQARLAMSDRESGVVGSVTHEFAVPALSGFRVTTPIVTDTIEAPSAASAAPPRAVMVVRRTFPAGATLYYQFTVHGASAGQPGAPARVTADHEVRRVDGTSIRRMEPRPITPAADGGLSRFSGIALFGVDPGDYELILRVTDQPTGRTIELREPFSLLPPVRGARAQ